MNSISRAGSSKQQLRVGRLAAIALFASLAATPGARAATTPVLQFNDQGFEQAGSGYTCS